MGYDSHSEYETESTLQMVRALKTGFDTAGPPPSSWSFLHSRYMELTGVWLLITLAPHCRQGQLQSLRNL